MANGEHEEEREFLAGLKARTGRDLAEWMAAIAAQGFHDKNEIIDWLRTQGLPFARASWLERIHRNSGKPIHAVGAPSMVGVGARAETRPAPVPPQVQPAAAPRPTQQRSVAVPPSVQPAPIQQVPAPPAPVQSEPVPSAPSQQAQAQPAPAKAASGKPARKVPPLVEAQTDMAALEKLVATAKGYRPLYHHLEAQIRQAVPGAVVAASGRYVSVGAPREFAAITPHPTEIRLGLDLGERPFDAQLQKAKLRGPGPGISHMVVLTDVRQVNGELLALIRSANARVNAQE